MQQNPATGMTQSTAVGSEISMAGGVPKLTTGAGSSYTPLQRSVQLPGTQKDQLNKVMNEPLSA